MSDDDKVQVSGHERSKPKRSRRATDLNQIAPDGGGRIVDTDAAMTAAISDPQKRANPGVKIVGGPVLSKGGPKIVKRG